MERSQLAFSTVSRHWQRLRGTRRNHRRTWTWTAIRTRSGLVRNHSPTDDGHHNGDEAEAKGTGADNSRDVTIGTSRSWNRLWAHSVA